MDMLQKEDNMDSAFECDFKNKYHDKASQYLKDGDKTAAISVTKRSLEECGKISPECATEVAPELTDVAADELKNNPTVLAVKGMHTVRKSSIKSLVQLVPSLMSKKKRTEAGPSKDMRLIMSARHAKQDRQARLAALEAHEDEEEYGALSNRSKKHFNGHRNRQ